MKYLILTIIGFLIIIPAFLQAANDDFKVKSLKTTALHNSSSQTLLAPVVVEGDRYKVTIEGPDGTKTVKIYCQTSHATCVVINDTDCPGCGYAITVRIYSDETYNDLLFENMADGYILTYTSYGVEVALQNSAP